MNTNKFRGIYISGKETNKQREDKIWRQFLEQDTYDYFVVLTPTKNFPKDELITGINRLIHWLNKYYYRYKPNHHITGVIKKEWGDWKSDDDWRRYYSENKDKKNKIPWGKILHYHLLLKIDDSRKKKLPVVMKKLSEKLFHTENIIEFDMKPKKFLGYQKNIFDSKVLGSKEEQLFQEPYVKKIRSQKASVKYIRKTKQADILYAEFHKDHLAETGVDNIGFITSCGIVGI